MAILPGFEKFFKPLMTDAQHKGFVCVHWITIILFAGLIVLVVANIWQILIKQGRWKTPPLLLFYTMTFMAIVLREICIITWALDDELWWKLPWIIQPMAKLDAGLI